MRKSILLLSLLFASSAFAQKYDIVIEGDRVMDPESGLDTTRNVGIANGKIMRVSADPPVGRRVVNAKGLVVAPGFVDLHQHGQDLDSGRVKAFDGVTTALEMAISVPASRALQASVTLIETLGGGWDAEKLPALP